MITIKIKQDLTTASPSSKIPHTYCITLFCKLSSLCQCFLCSDLDTKLPEVKDSICYLLWPHRILSKGLDCTYQFYAIWSVCFLVSQWLLMCWYNSFSFISELSFTNISERLLQAPFISLTHSVVKKGRRTELQCGT